MLNWIRLEGEKEKADEGRQKEEEVIKVEERNSGFKEKPRVWGLVITFWEVLDHEDTHTHTYSHKERGWEIQPLENCLVRTKNPEQEGKKKEQGEKFKETEKVQTDIWDR